MPVHTHPFNGPFSGTTQVSRYQIGETHLDFSEARDSEWQWHQLGHMQVCTLLQTDNHASNPPLSFYRPDALPAAQATVSKHWRANSVPVMHKLQLIVCNLQEQKIKRSIFFGTQPISCPHCQGCYRPKLPDFPGPLLRRFPGLFTTFYAVLLSNYKNNQTVTINTEPAQCCHHTVSNTLMHTAQTLIIWHLTYLLCKSHGTKISHKLWLKWLSRHVTFSYEMLRKRFTRHALTLLYTTLKNAQMRLAVFKDFQIPELSSPKLLKSMRNWFIMMTNMQINTQC